MGCEEAGRHVRAVRLVDVQIRNISESIPGCAPLTDRDTWPSSDADSDVLADYVLALVRADTSEPELRINAIENLEDFLKPSKLLCYVVMGITRSTEMLIPAVASLRHSSLR